MEYKNKDIIAKLIKQIYSQVDEIRESKEEVEYLKKELKNMENKYYLKSVKLIQDNSQGYLYYECEYSNGIMTKIEINKFKNDLVIPIELK